VFQHPQNILTSLNKYLIGEPFEVEKKGEKTSLFENFEVKRSTSFRRCRQQTTSQLTSPQVTRFVCFLLLLVLLLLFSHSNQQLHCPLERAFRKSVKKTSTAILWRN